MSKRNNSSGGGLGCGGMIITGLIIWAFIFGWTWDGKHYDVTCSCERGVVVE